ncbi:hypothetical protein JCM1840_005080 [Sporobolomyces johnsonii]
MTAAQKHILSKGAACATCKARKVRCDAIKPACTACRRSARFKGLNPDEVVCSYFDGRKCRVGSKGDKAVRGVAVPKAGKGKGKAVVEEEHSPGNVSSSEGEDDAHSHVHVVDVPLPPTRAQPVLQAILPAPVASTSTAVPSLTKTPEPVFPLTLPAPLSMPSSSRPLASSLSFPALAPNFGGDLPFDASAVALSAATAYVSVLPPAPYLTPTSDSTSLHPFFAASPASIKNSPSPYDNFSSLSSSSLASFSALSSSSSIEPSPVSFADDLTYYLAKPSHPMLHPPSPPLSASSSCSSLDEELAHCFLPSAHDFDATLSLPLLTKPVQLW